MTSILPNPTVLDSHTRFRPTSIRAHSRSPSRSPVRKEAFVARELDPLIANLSPDSTLRALQSTEALSNGSAGDSALARSIADASPAERQFGVRAALAAQKLRQWHQEVAAWQWPARKDRVAGRGFLPPEKVQRFGPTLNDEYVGSLTSVQADEYEERLEEIYDGLEALDVEELKAYVLDAHRSTSKASSPQVAHGDWRAHRLRDFTALITATIVQALPDLANLNVLLHSWEVRLTVLRQAPRLLQKLTSTETAIRTASQVIHDSKSGPLVTKAEVETARDVLEGQVSSLGAEFDKMLDLLEGADDALPAAWTDRMDQVELDFATWVVEGQQRAMRNDLQQMRASITPVAPVIAEQQANNRQSTTPTRFPSLSDRHQRPQTAVRDQSQAHDVEVQPDVAATAPSPVVEREQTNVVARTPSKRKTPSRLELPPPGHKRGVSEVSMAESNYSTMTGISDAEIVDARSTQVVSSPKVSLVDNTFPASREDLSDYPAEARPRVRSMHIYGKDAYKHVEDVAGHSRAKSMDLDQYQLPAYDAPAQALGSLQARTGAENDRAMRDEDMMRPTDIHRVSTASLEMLSRGQVKRIDLNRRMSQDSSARLSSHAHDTSSQSTARARDRDTLSQDGSFADPGSPVAPSHRSRGSTYENSPLRSRSGTLEDELSTAPSLPRQSSKRQSQNVDALADEVVMPFDVSSFDTSPFPHAAASSPIESAVSNEASPRSPTKSKGTEKSLEAKIQNILTTLPTRIRLARSDTDVDENPSQPSTTSSTRSTTPTPSLTLSPAKQESTSRRNAGSESDVKVYHLSRSGAPRDTQPTKLFVRLVGEQGERVMVRVGGGWADLGEYLKEYSLHHGRHSIAHGRLEVANMPSLGRRDTGLNSSPVTPSTSAYVNASPDFTPNAQPSLDFGGLRNIDVPKPRDPTAGSSRTPSSLPFPTPSTNSSSLTTNAPPVGIHSSHTVYTPTMTTTMRNGVGSTTLTQPAAPTSSAHSRTTAPDPNTPTSISSTTASPTVSSTTTFYSSSSPSTNSNSKYTPLGAAGPKNSQRRVATLGSHPPSGPPDELVDGLVGKARAVSSGNYPQQQQQSPGGGVVGPSSSASSTISDSSTARRFPGVEQGSPVSSMRSPSPMVTSNVNTSSGLKGSVSGVRRVFLRRKADQ